MTDEPDRMETLRCREAAAKERLRLAASDLKEAVLTGARREQREHPWALPIAGFCAGFLVPFLVPDRRSHERVSRVVAAPPSRSQLREAWVDARCAAADALSLAVGAAVRSLLDSVSRKRPGDPDGCSR